MSGPEAAQPPGPTLVFGAETVGDGPPDLPGRPASGRPASGAPDRPRVRNPLRRAERPGSAAAAREREAVRRARARRRAARRRMAPRTRHGSVGLLAVLLLAACSLLLVDLRTDGSAFEPVRRGAAVVLSPLQRMVGWLASPVLPDPLAADPQQVAALRAEVERLRATAASSSSQRARLAELEAVTGLARTTDVQIRMAEVVAADRHSLVVSAGSGDGVRAGQAVVAGGGLIGRVVSTTPGTAEIVLISAPDLVVGVRLDRTGAIAAMSGTGRSDALHAELLDPRAGARVGDGVVTHTSAGPAPYPAGLPVGEVAAVEREPTGRTILTIAPIGRVGEVGIVGVVVSDPRARTSPPASAVPSPSDGPAAPGDRAAGRQAPSDAATEAPSPSAAGARGTDLGSRP